MEAFQNRALVGIAEIGAEQRLAGAAALEGAVGAVVGAADAMSAALSALAGLLVANPVSLSSRLGSGEMEKELDRTRRRRRSASDWPWRRRQGTFASSPPSSPTAFSSPSPSSPRLHLH